MAVNPQPVNARHVKPGDQTDHQGNQRRKNLHGFSDVTSRLCIQSLAVVLFVTHLVAQLPPRPIDGKLGIQDERGRIIMDERGRHLLPDLAPGALSSPYLYYSFTNGSLINSNNGNYYITDVTGNGRWATAGSTGLTPSGIIGYGLNIQYKIPGGGLFGDQIDYYVAALRSDFSNSFSVRMWVYLTNWDFSNLYYSGIGAYGVGPAFLEKYGANVGIGAWNRSPTSDLRLLLVTNHNDVSISNPIEEQILVPNIGNTLTLSNWTHLVLTWEISSGVLTLYSQGHSVASAIHDPRSSIAEFDFGDLYRSWGGKMDEIVIVNDRCWTPAQVLDDYHSGAGRTFP